MADQVIPLTDLASAYAASPSKDKIPGLRTAFSTEVLAANVVMAVTNLAKTELDGHLMECLLEALQRFGPDAGRNGSCDAVYAVGRTNRHNRDAALAVLKWIRHFSDQFGVTGEEYLLKSGLTRLSIGIGEAFTKDKELAKEALDTYMSLAQKGTRKTRQQLKLMGISELSAEIRRQHSQSETIARNVEAVRALLRLDDKPGLLAMCCFATAVSNQLSI